MFSQSVGGLFAIGLEERGEVIGVAIVGRPVARMLQNGYTAEITRLCVRDGFYNACSILAALQQAEYNAMGYRRLITYILKTERGDSLKAAGFKQKIIGEVGGGSWNRQDRPRVDTHPIEQKKLFEVGINQ